METPNINNKPNLIYNMNLHDAIYVDSGLTIMRVASGWNYIYYTFDQNKGWELFQIVFVPYDNRFADSDSGHINPDGPA